MYGTELYSLLLFYSDKTCACRSENERPVNRAKLHHPRCLNSKYRSTALEPFPPARILSVPNYPAVYPAFFLVVYAPAQLKMCFG